MSPNFQSTTPKTIGYIIPSDTYPSNEPFFREFIRGITDEANLRRYKLFVTNVAPSSDEEKKLYCQLIKEKKIDGIVLNRINLIDWRVGYLTKINFPFVSLERSLSHNIFWGIEVDSQHGMKELMTHLTQKGHARIAYIGGKNNLKTDFDRLNGYFSGLAAASIQPDQTLIKDVELTREAGFQAAYDLLSENNPPTAIVCINDLIAFGAIDAAHMLKLIIGQDISIAGFDGTPEAVETHPPLTTLDQSVYNIARILSSMLIKRIEGSEIPERQICITPKLILRESTGFFKKIYKFNSE